MEKERKSEIALKYLKHMIREKEIKFTSKVQHRVKQIAKDIYIPPEEALEFTENLIREAQGEALRLAPAISARIHSRKQIDKMIGF